ncbi:hypothetical protein KUA24_61 [Vibrio phage HNL01]|nr:hypothetical protein KUA24_61 [Vibrio phage HNL01]
MTDSKKNFPHIVKKFNREKQGWDLYKVDKETEQLVIELEAVSDTCLMADITGDGKFDTHYNVIRALINSLVEGGRYMGNTNSDDFL